MAQLNTATILDAVLIHRSPRLISLSVHELLELTSLVAFRPLCVVQSAAMVIKFARAIKVDNGAPFRRALREREVTCGLATLSHVHIFFFKLTSYLLFGSLVL